MNYPEEDFFDFSGGLIGKFIPFYCDEDSNNYVSDDEKVIY